ncbi:uncharacterized protein BDV17DRAFT_283379 [Aspergillus undulatus]|uniref:uncharacterized protein n=1 Tax=Aspergillus undulatus TaxID=1810928 RepID=UPI003CCE4A77
MDYSQTDIPSVQDLLQSGEPFVPFSEVSAQFIQAQSNEDVSRWIESKLHDGRPFVIRGLAEQDQWQKAVLNSGNLINLSDSEAIPVRNCQTGRDVKMRLRDLRPSDNARTDNVRESLYAKDLHCPSQWVKSLEALLPSCLRHLGSLDLFRVLPKDITPEVLMAYVGTRKSFSGFHRCFSATVALNLLIDSEGDGSGSICFGTDRNSQGRYDAFMEKLGNSPHTDWANVSIDKLKTAEFPIYVTDQRPGDLVIFPSASAHQIWNVSNMVTKTVWNIMPAASIAAFFEYVQPAYQKQCHADTGRVPLIPMYGLRSGTCRREEEISLALVFQKQFDDDHAERDTMPPSTKTVDTQGAVVECNFCGLAIWNRHLHCNRCGDFDLCLTCFVSGRSCQHIADYTWVELLQRGRCQEILQVSKKLIRPRRQLSLVSVALSTMRSRQQSTERLCHLCRDNHPAWKGTVCKRCSAFFCYRSLYRHFDIDLIQFLRNAGAWSCPKCEQFCNCRCCHFRHPYQSKDKPARARVKAIDSRGRILGFVDNVFDQKRGKRASLMAASASPQPDLPSRGVKRSRTHTDDGETENPRQHEGAIANSGAQFIRTPGPDVSEVNYAPDRNGVRHVSSQTLGPFAPSQNEDQVEPLLPFPRQSSEISHRPPPSSFAAISGELARRNNVISANKESIRDSENKLEALRGYADELLELSLAESHAKVLDRISQLEAKIDEQKRRKAELLLSRLGRDFPDLADVAREEARRRGL